MTDVTVTLTYTEQEAREVIRAVRYFDSNVSATYEDHDRMNLIQSAIQHALPKPKPAEPTGLGAVVEDADGELWVRDKITTTVAHWKRARGQEGGKRHPYAYIAAVRVLSEGVTA